MSFSIPNQNIYFSHGYSIRKVSTFPSTPQANLPTFFTRCHKHTENSLAQQHTSIGDRMYIIIPPSSPQAPPVECSGSAMVMLRIRPHAEDGDPNRATRKMIAWSLSSACNSHPPVPLPKRQTETGSTFKDGSIAPHCCVFTSTHSPCATQQVKIIVKCWHTMPNCRGIAWSQITQATLMPTKLGYKQITKEPNSTTTKLRMTR